MRWGGEPHGISLENAEKAAEKVSVFVSIVAPKPSMATAPRGRGWVMMPTMVPRKMASRCHACAFTPAGGGRNHTTTATATEMPKFFMSAPHLKGGSEGAAGEAASEPLALALISLNCLRSLRWLRIVRAAVGLVLAILVLALRHTGADVWHLLEGMRLWERASASEGAVLAIVALKAPETAMIQIVGRLGRWANDWRWRGFGAKVGLLLSCEQLNLFEICHLSLRS